MYHIVSVKGRGDAPCCPGTAVGGAVALMICVIDHHHRTCSRFADIMAIRCKGLDCDSLNFDLDVYSRVLPYIMRMSQVSVGGVHMFSMMC